jgi:uncharacterized membrane protein
MNDRWIQRAVIGVTIGAAVLLALGGPAALRIPLLAAFVLLCPGLAWTPLLRTGDVGDTLAISVGLGIALAALVAQTMALAGWWSPGAGFLVLAAVTVVGLSMQRREASGTDDAEPPSDEDPGAAADAGAAERA